MHTTHPLAVNGSVTPAYDVQYHFTQCNSHLLTHTYKVLEAAAGTVAGMRLSHVTNPHHKHMMLSLQDKAPAVGGKYAQRLYADNMLLAHGAYYVYSLLLGCLLAEEQHQ